jgi:ketosteroid isomerase-like protein
MAQGADGEILRAMSQENVAVVLRSIQAFEHDEEAWLSTMDPGIEWYPIEEGHSLSRGHQAAIRVRRSWLENWEGHQVDVEEIEDGADSVVACLHLTGRGVRSGVEVDLRIYMHFKLRDGKIVYLYEYADREAALEAAGLSE